MTSNTLPPNPRKMRWERYAGVTPQFERIDNGYLFRRDRCGPAIRVSIPERDAFAADGRRALFWHVAALLVCGAAGWLAVDSLMADQPVTDGGKVAAAILLGIVEALIAMVLYGSLRWHADAPGRALAGRPIERPARDPDFAERLDTASIIAMTLLLLVVAALGTKLPSSFYISFASASVMLAPFLLVRRWRFNRSLTPDQRARAREVARQERMRGGAPDRHPMMALFVLVVILAFIAAEFVAVAIGFTLGSDIVLDSAQRTFDTADGVTTTGAILLGLGLAILFGWLVDLLGRCVTRLSPFRLIWELAPSW